MNRETAGASAALRQQIELLTALAWGDPEFTRNLIEAPAKARAKYALARRSDEPIAIVASNATGTAVESVWPQSAKRMHEALRIEVNGLLHSPLEKDGQDIANQIRAANERLKGKGSIVVVGPDPMHRKTRSGEGDRQKRLIDVRHHTDATAALKAPGVQQGLRTTPGLVIEEASGRTFARLGDQSIEIEGQWTKATLETIGEERAPRWTLAQRAALIHLADLGVIVANVTTEEETRWARAGVSPAAARTVQEAIEPWVKETSSQRTTIARAMKHAIGEFAVLTRESSMGASAVCITTHSLDAQTMRATAQELLERKVPWIIVHRGDTAWWTITGGGLENEPCVLCASEQIGRGRRGASTRAAQDTVHDERTEGAMRDVSAQWMRSLARRDRGTRATWIADDAPTRMIEQEIDRNPQCVVCGWPRIQGRQERAETLCKVDIGSNLLRDIETWTEHRHLLDARIRAEAEPLTGRWATATMRNLASADNERRSIHVQINTGDRGARRKGEEPCTCEGNGESIAEALGEALRSAIAFDANRWSGKHRHGARFTSARALAREGETIYGCEDDEGMAQEHEAASRWWVQARVLHSEERVWTPARTFLEGVPGEAETSSETAIIAADASRGGALLNALLAHAQSRDNVRRWRRCAVAKTRIAEALISSGWTLTMEADDTAPPLHRRRATARREEERVETQSTELEEAEAERRCLMKLAGEIMKAGGAEAASVEQLEKLREQATREGNIDALLEARSEEDGQWSENAEEGEEGEWMTRTCRSVIASIEEGQEGSLIGIDLNDERQTPYNAVGIATARRTIR